MLAQQRSDSFQRFSRPLLGMGCTFQSCLVSNEAVCLVRTAACHKSNHSKLPHVIYFCMGGPLYIRELSDSRMLERKVKKSFA